MPFLSHNRIAKQKRGYLIHPNLRTSVEPQVAWSQRKVNSSFTGSPWRVKRSTDLAETNVDFIASGKFSTADIATMESWGTGATIYLTKIYDQYGSNDYIQGTVANMPTWDATNQYWSHDSNRFMTTALSISNQNYTDSIILDTKESLATTAPSYGNYGFFHNSAVANEASRWMNHLNIWNDATNYFIMFYGDGTATNRVQFIGTRTQFHTAGLAVLVYNASGKKYKFQHERGTVNAGTERMRINQYEVTPTVTVLAGAEASTIVNFSPVFGAKTYGGGPNNFIGGAYERIIWTSVLSAEDKTIFDNWSNDFHNIW